LLQWLPQWKPSAIDLVRSMPSRHFTQPRITDSHASRSRSLRAIARSLSHLARRQQARSARQLSTRVQPKSLESPRECGRPAHRAVRSPHAQRASQSTSGSRRAHLRPACSVSRRASLDHSTVATHVVDTTTIHNTAAADLTSPAFSHPTTRTTKEISMCDPLTATIIATATAAVGQIGAYQTGKAQARALAQQSQVQSDEISAAAGNELTERARAARRERATARAAGSEAGINLGSGSFIAALQNSAFNQYNDQGLIIQNERNQQRARIANTNSLASQIQIPSACPQRSPSAAQASVRGTRRPPPRSAARRRRSPRLVTDEASNALAARSHSVRQNAQRRRLHHPRASPACCVGRHRRRPSASPSSASASASASADQLSSFGSTPPSRCIVDRRRSEQLARRCGSQP
jgi:hypothetical protein